MRKYSYSYSYILQANEQNINVKITLYIFNQGSSYYCRGAQIRAGAEPPSPFTLTIEYETNQAKYWGGGIRCVVPNQIISDIQTFPGFGAYVDVHAYTFTAGGRCRRTRWQRQQPVGGSRRSLCGTRCQQRPRSHSPGDQQQQQRTGDHRAACHVQQDVHSADNPFLLRAVALRLPVRLHRPHSCPWVYRLLLYFFRGRF